MTTKLPVLILVFMIAFPDILYGITIIHHDKPEASTISKMATTMTEAVPSTVLPDRHKRLLPYINYYVSRNHRKPTREKFTPFLESNALPGPFVPIIKTTTYDPEPTVAEKSPNYVEIYETLARLKQAQQTMRQNQGYRKPPVRYVPIQYYHDESHRTVPLDKTTIETYTPTNIDIEIGDKKKYVPTSTLGYKLYPQKPQIDTYVIEKPVDTYRIPPPKPYFGEKILIQKPIVVPSEYEQNEKPVSYTIQTTPKPQVNTIVDEEYIAQKFTPIETTQEAVYPEERHPAQYVSERPITHVQQYYSSPVPNAPTENTNILAKLLKQLQNSNMLPQTFTPQNIDNSIKTLVKIFNGLRKQQGLKAKPIIVVEEDSTEPVESEEVEEKPFPEKVSYAPGTLTQTFPANTIDGGTPGRPGIDYPALSSIPQTDFNCKTQRYKGFFGDPHTNCQVWHYCDLNGGQASFLCPNGTIFSQVALTCDWWYNVKCSSTAQLYVLNERLYKYILPLAPKFPEDYSGPLVDRYLALKFQEMEEKMKKEKKEEDTSEEEKDDSDQLQDIRNEKAKSEEK